MAAQGNSPAVMPMKLIASWDLERTTSATCVPRLCTLTLTHLDALRVLDPGLQRITIGVALKGSRHTLRSNDIEVPSNGVFSMDLQITFALQYPHNIKRDVNVLRVMLQRRKRYKTKPIPGYRTLAVGQVNLSEVIQHDLGSDLLLYAPKNKDGEAEHVSTVSLGVLTSQAIDTTRHSHGLMPQDVDSSEEEQEFYEASDDDEAPPMPGVYDEALAPQHQHRHTQRLQALHLLKGMAKKRLNRGKFFQFPRRGKLSGVECEDPEEEHEEMERMGGMGGMMAAMELDEAFAGSDFLPSDENDMDLSDSDFDLDPETMSVRSTPKPVLRPFYAPSTTSSSSASLRGPTNVGGNQRSAAQQPAAQATTPSNSHMPRGLKHRVEQVREKAEKTLKKEPKEPKEPKESRNDDRDRVQAQEGRLDKEHGRRSGDERQNRRSLSGEDPSRLGKRDPKDDERQARKSSSFGESVIGLTPASVERVAMSSSGTAICVTGDNMIPPGYPFSVPQEFGLSDYSSPGKHLVLRQRSFSAIPSRRNNTNTTPNTPQRTSAAEIATMCCRNVAPEVDPEIIIQLNEGTAADRTSSLLADMPPYIVLLNACDPHGVSVGRALVDAGMPVVCTMSGEQVQSVMTAVVSKLLKYCSTHTGDPSLGLCIIGSEGYTNTVLQAFVKLVTSKSSLKLSFFRFYVVPLGINRLASYIASTDGVYWALFQDPQWKEAFESHDANWEHLSLDLFSRLNRYLQMATATRQLPIAQALVNRSKTSSESDSGQVYVYFLNEVRLGCWDHNDLLAASDDLLNSSNLDRPVPGTPASSVVANPLAGGEMEQGKCNQSSPPLNQTPHAFKDVLSSGASTPLGPSAGTPLSMLACGAESLDLALDYWPVVSSTNSGASNSGKKEKELGKLTVRPTVRCAWISALPTNIHGQPSPTNAFTMVLVPKEKSKRALPFPLPRRSHGRDKDKDAVENAFISKLVCSSPKRSVMLKVYIDTVEWSDVKFFSLSQPSRTLYFPVATFSDANSTNNVPDLHLPMLSSEPADPAFSMSDV